MGEQDSVWKEILDAYFEEFMEFFFPRNHARIDWGQGYQFLDKELEKLRQENEVGRRLVDKLVKVFLKDGKETWVLVHIEVQGQPEEIFAERVFTYGYRIIDRYHRKVATMVILTDKNRRFRPTKYDYELLDYEIHCKFPMVKIIDYNSKWAELEANPNPFAVVVMAQLKALMVKKPQQRLNWKVELVRMLYERKYSRQQIINLFRFIDWLISLPKELEPKFEQEVKKLEEERMPYVTSIERNAIERGKKEGLEQGLERGLVQGQLVTLQEIVQRQLTRRFGELGPEVEPQLKTLTAAQLEDLAVALLDFSTSEDLHAWLETAPKEPK